MGEYKSFEELKEVCKNFVDISKKRGAYDGIKKLLTELYPDKAHFIYELLQNAEDMMATEVSFKLTSDTLIFEHNGTKRDFNLDDISAITNVGQSPKRDDPTSIGQFGVGFKAVYAYTKTPEIHSGEYDFKIIDMLVPEDDGVEKRARSGFTQFIFPLGTETKTVSVALQEIENGLQSLNEDSILFLSHIKNIRFKLNNGTYGGITNINEGNHINKVVVRRPNDDKPNVSYFLKFDKEVDVTIKEQQEKRYVSVAYRINKKDNKFIFDSSLRGRVCIYFPAEKEVNNLRFHINAPFASTVARDSIRDCFENTRLINKIAELVCESIDWIKNNNLWDRSIYAVLPNSKDINTNKTGIVECLQSRVKNKFLTSELIQTNQQLFVKTTECVQVGRAIAKVFSNEDFKQLEGHYYILAAQPSTNEYYFFTDLSISVINEDKFITLLKDYPNAVERIIKTKTTTWLSDFYSVLYDIWKDRKYNPSELSRIKMIPSTKDVLYRASDKIYIESYYKPKNIKDPIYVNQTIVKDEKANWFLTQVLNIPIMSVKEDNMEEILGGNSDSAISGMIGILEEYDKVTDLYEFINKYKNEPIFLAQHTFYEDLCRVKASDCCWSSDVAPFYKKSEYVSIVKDNGKTYRSVKCARILAIDEYKKIFNSEEIKKLKRLFSLLGGNLVPKIIECDVKDNPLCKQWINTHKFRETKVEKSDYTVTGLDIIDELVENNCVDSILLLWDTLIRSNTIKDDYLNGCFMPSKNGDAWHGESTLVYYLKRKKWLPNRNGGYFRPCEITEKELHNSFIFTDTPLLKAIGFGDKSQQSIETIERIKEVVPDVNEQQQKLIALILEQPELAETMFQQVREKDRLGLHDALKKQNKLQRETEDEDSYGRKIGVKNPEERLKKIQDIFEKGLQNPQKRNKSIKFTYGANIDKEEKMFVFHQYKGACQICGNAAITKYDGSPHFVAVNIIDTSNLKDELLTDISRGWNTLCLCPNCAAKYKYCAKNLDTFAEQVFSQTVEAKNENYIIITIELQGEQTEIRFTPAHFLALQAAFNTYGNETDE